MNEKIINFYSENDFVLGEAVLYEEWLNRVAASEGKKVGEISYIFCDDRYLLNLNIQYLNHDTYTDIITFDNSIGNILNSDVYISTERVAENALTYGVSFSAELKRVMVHGLLHLCGYKDKSEQEEETMRSKEEEKMKMFHVEQ